MKPTLLVLSFWIAMFLAHLMRTSSRLSKVKITYKKVPKIKKQGKQKQEFRAFFPSTIVIPRDSEEGVEEVQSPMHERRTCFAQDMETWRQLKNDDTGPIFPTFSKFHPEYGLMFNDLGRLVPGVKKTYLFMTIDILTPETLNDIRFKFPDCAEWAAANLRNWRSTEVNPQPIRELVHQHICREMTEVYRDIFKGIEEDWDQMTHIIDTQIPSFLPNCLVNSSNGPRTIVAPNGQIWYSRQYLDKQNRQKRLAILPILTGINVVGGLMAKGFDVYNNYRCNKAMTAAMDTLMENDRKFHKRMLTLEDNLGLVTQMVVTGFERINTGFQLLNRSIARTTFTLESMLNQTERRFKDVHETLNNHHLALYFLSKGILGLIPLMCRYRQAVTNYRLLVKGFLDGLDELSTGCYEVLDPIMLSKNLRLIANDLDRSHSDYVLAFQHMYQYYAEPLYRSQIHQTIY